VVAVVSQPDRPRGRGQRVAPSPVAQVAERAGLPLLRPERVADAECADWLAAREPDLGVVAAFGQFLPRRLRELPSLGYLINAHASLLPRWRGAAPIARAILAGDAETGISVMRVEREMDAGPVLLLRRTPIGPDETAGELEARLAALAADAIAEAVARIAAGDAHWTPQDDADATLAPRLERGEAELDFGEPAAALARRVRAMAPRPGAFTWFEDEPLRILAAETLPGPVDAAPGVARTGGEPPLRIAAAEGWLAPRVLQRAGGRPLDVHAFLRGRALHDGTRLGRAA
jgi:methionyl-tRNA formyltransferase